MRLNGLARHKQGSGHLGVVLAATRNPGNLKFLWAELLEPVMSADPVRGPLIFYAGCRQFGCCAGGPWSRAETLEKDEGLMERFTRSDDTTVAAHRRPGTQQRACLLEWDRADGVQRGEGRSKQALRLVGIGCQDSLRPAADGTRVGQSGCLGSLIQPIENPCAAVHFSSACQGFREVSGHRDHVGIVRTLTGAQVP